MKIKKILLVGGSGYVGKEFQKQLMDLGIESHSISRKNNFDIYGNHSLLKNFKHSDFDCCIFLSPVSSLTEVYTESLRQKISCQLEMLFATLSRICNSNIIYFSSNHVYSGSNGPYTATTAPDGVTGFSFAKLYAEKLCSSYFNRHLIIRTSLLIDENSSSAFLSWIKKSLSLNNKISVRNDILASPTLVSTVVSDCLKIMIGNENLHLVHLSSGIQTSKLKIAKAFARKLNLNPALIAPEKFDEQYPIQPGNYTLISNYFGETETSAKRIYDFFRGDL